MDQAESRMRRWGLAVLLAFLCLVAYDPTRSENTTGDTISSRFLPLSILKHRTFTLTPFISHFDGVAYAGVYNARKEYVPRGGWGMGLMSLPVYAVADALGLGGEEWTHRRVNQASRWSAIVYATGAVLLIFFMLTRFLALAPAFAGACLFAFGTWNWSMGPQGLYSQTGAVFLHALSLLLLWDLAQPGRGAKGFSWKAGLLGLAHGLVWAHRPFDVVLLLPAVPILLRARAILPYALGGILVTGPLMLAYKDAYGYYFGFYTFMEDAGGLDTFRKEFWIGLFGQLFSPNRGAIVFFPLLFLVPVFWKLMGRAQVPKAYSRMLAASSIAYLSLLCFVEYWHGTWAYGTRYQYDVMPYVWPAVALGMAEAGAWLSGSAKLALPRWVLGLAALFAAQGVTVHALGHRNYDLYVWNYAVVPVDDRNVWWFNELMMEHVWRAGSNKNRWPDEYARLKHFGF